MKALREHSKARTSAKMAKYMKGGSATDCRADGGTVKAKKTAHSAPITVDGKAARPRLDRPGRKMRADGGSTISEDSRREAARLRGEATSGVNKTAGELVKDAMIAGSGSVIHGLSRGRSGRAFGRAMQGLGIAGGALDSGVGIANHISSSNEARRIERGQAEPGKEDRKSGGRVKR